MIILIGIKLRSPVSISYIYAPASETHQKVIHKDTFKFEKNIKGAFDAGLLARSIHTHEATNDLKIAKSQFCII